MGVPLPVATQFERCEAAAEAVQPVFDAALKVLQAAGAELVELPPGGGLEDINPEALTAEAWNFKHDMAAYLAAAPPAVKVRTVEDLLAFHKTDPRESKIGVQYWEESAAATGGFENPKYIELMKYLKRASGPEGYAALFTQHNLTALVSPAGSPADLIPADGISRPGQRKKGAPSLTWHAAVGGYPLLTVPMGAVGGMPVGLSFVGPQWSEAALLSYGYAYEQAGYKRVPPQGYKKVGPSN